MTTIFDKPELLGAAVFFLGASYGIIKWVGHTIRDQLGPGVTRGSQPFLPEHVDAVPPALVKLAVERGLVTPSQLAVMTPMERQFLMASLKDKLTPAPPEPSPPAAAAVAPATGPPSPRAINAAEFGMAAMPASDRLRVHCALCGEMLDLPAFAPYVGHCRRCGAKTVLREDETGRYVLNVTPARARQADRG
jgi:hypothetical protein